MARGMHQGPQFHSPGDSSRCDVGNNWNNCRRRVVHHRSVAGTVEKRELSRFKHLIVGLFGLRKANRRSI